MLLRLLVARKDLVQGEVKRNVVNVCYLAPQINP